MCRPGWKGVRSSNIDTAANDGKPFFLDLPLTSPHYPVAPAARFKGRSKAGDYGDVRDAMSPLPRVSFHPRGAPMLDECPYVLILAYAPGLTSPTTSGPLSLVNITSVFSATPLRWSASSTSPTA